MAKRFTDTDKWKRPWFRALSIKAKTVWIYLCDNCDHAGIWLADFGLLSFQVGFSISEHEFLEWLNPKVIKIDDDRFYIPSFVEFQYGTLRDNNSVHLSVIKSLQKYGIEPAIESGYSQHPRAIMARLSQKKKSSVMAEDFFKCTYCGQAGDDKTLVIDHIVPRTKGGQNDEHNLTTACVSCNAKKSDLDAEKFIERQGLSETLSESLRIKIGVIKTLNGAFRSLNGPKDKEEDKDKEKDMDKDMGIVKGDCVEAIDFEDVYAAYPQKKGKTRGFEKLRKDIKTQSDLSDLKLAIANYSQSVLNTDPKFIKHFSTFASEWKDWIHFVPSIGTDPFAEFLRDEKAGA